MGKTISVRCLLYFNLINCLIFILLLFRNSASDSDTNAAAATEFHRRFHISVDETEGQGNQVIPTNIVLH